jgi:hypothetical protein
MKPTGIAWCQINRVSVLRHEEAEDFVAKSWLLLSFVLFAFHSWRVQQRHLGKSIFGVGRAIQVKSLPRSTHRPTSLRLRQVSLLVQQVHRHDVLAINLRYA